MKGTCRWCKSETDGQDFCNPHCYDQFIMAEAEMNEELDLVMIKDLPEPEYELDLTFFDDSEIPW